MLAGEGPQAVKALEAGGNGEYFYITEHSLANGHMVASEEGLWQRQ